jgi:hypothetical protein
MLWYLILLDILCFVIIIVAAYFGYDWYSTPTPTSVPEITYSPLIPTAKPTPSSIEYIVPSGLNGNYPSAINSMNIYGITLNDNNDTIKFSRYINTMYFLTKYSLNIDVNIDSYNFKFSICLILKNHVALYNILNKCPNSFTNFFKILNNNIIILYNNFVNNNNQNISNNLNTIFSLLNDYIQYMPTTTPSSTIVPTQSIVPINIIDFINSNDNNNLSKISSPIICIIVLTKYCPNNETDKNINYISQIIFSNCQDIYDISIIIYSDKTNIYIPTINNYLISLNTNIGFLKTNYSNQNYTNIRNDIMNISKIKIE